MIKLPRPGAAACAALLFVVAPLRAQDAPPPPPAPGPNTTDILYTATSPYHNIAVKDEGDLRTLYFDDTMESRMLVDDPLGGAFEYTDYFEMPWLWNPDIKKVLMLGLGGASTQKALVHYHPDVTVQSVDIDPVVAEVAQEFFHYEPSARQKLAVLDGRVYLRSSQDKYDVILLDAYTQGRYGASIPPHLVTKEFFQLARDHLTPNGVLAYNVISTLRDYHTDIVAAIYHTLKEVFPQVYVFPAKTSLNVVIVATLDKNPATLDALRKTAKALVDSKRMTFPNFLERVESFQPAPDGNYLDSPVLTDDFAPVESLTGPAAAQPPTHPTP
jgi:spermidine synthase